MELLVISIETQKKKKYRDFFCESEKKFTKDVAGWLNAISQKQYDTCTDEGQLLGNSENIGLLS